MLISGPILSEPSGSDSLNLFENLYLSIFKLNLAREFWESGVGTVGLK